MKSYKKEDFDESCFIYFKQTVQKKALNLPPNAQMVCFKKKTTKDKNGVEREEFFVTRSEDYMDAIHHVKEMSIPDNLIDRSDVFHRNIVEHNLSGSLFKGQTASKIIAIFHLF